MKLNTQRHGGDSGLGSTILLSSPYSVVLRIQMFVKCISCLPSVMKTKISYLSFPGQNPNMCERGQPTLTGCACGHCTLQSVPQYKRSPKKQLKLQCHLALNLVVVFDTTLGEIRTRFLCSSLHPIIVILWLWQPVAAHRDNHC